MRYTLCITQYKLSRVFFRDFVWSGHSCPLPLTFLKAILEADIAPKKRTQLLTRLRVKVQGAAAFKNQWELLASIRDAESKQDAPRDKIFAHLLAEDS